MPTYLDFEKSIADLDKRIAELKNFSYHLPPRVAEEIAGLAAYLASAEADSITGQALSLDGGMVMA